MLTRSTASHLLAPTLMPPLLRLAKSESCRIFSIKGRTWAQQTKISSSSSDNQTVSIVSSPKTKDEDDYSASEVVKSFYQGINDHDLSFVEKLIAENCVYEDLIYPRPFVGRKVKSLDSRHTLSSRRLFPVEKSKGNWVILQAILEFFKKFNDSISKDLQFVIDDISTEDSLAVGVTWHLEWKGKPFPFSKGCSFYRLEVINNERQIVYGRDSVEPAIKPGDAALVIIQGVTWLLQRFPQLANML